MGKGEKKLYRHKTSIKYEMSFLNSCFAIRVSGSNKRTCKEVINVSFSGYI